MTAAGSLESVWKDYAPFDAVTGLFDDFKFNSTYSYPVIKMRTPDALAQFYTSEYIVFIDFGGDMFKKYCLWVRNLAKAFIWFKFALRILSKFKVHFNIA